MEKDAIDVTMRFVVGSFTVFIFIANTAFLY